jgi:Holliday junction resolvase RusA-like endonuclease
MIKIVCNGEPVAKGRPIVGKVGGKVTVRTPARTRAHESALAAAGREAMQGKPPLDGRFGAMFVFVLPVPKSWPADKRNAALADDIRPIGKPDLDNLIKAACDALNGIAWVDDSQIVSINALKIYGDRPRTEIYANGAVNVTFAIMRGEG